MTVFGRAKAAFLRLRHGIPSHDTFSWVFRLLEIGNDSFTWFATRASKSRLNFLDLLRAA